MIAVPTLNVVAVATPTERPLAFKVFVLPEISNSVAVIIPEIFASPVTSSADVGDAFLIPKLPEPLNTALTAALLTSTKRRSGVDVLP